MKSLYKMGFLGVKNHLWWVKNYNRYGYWLSLASRKNMQNKGLL